MIQLPAVEADLFNGLKMAGIDVVEVRCDAAGLSNIAYASIRTTGRGDAKQALAVMLTCSKQGLPKIAMVFDDDVDIWDDNRVKWAMAFRYMPDRDTIIIPQCNTMSTDPKIEGDPGKPFYSSRIGLDCTIPLVGNWDRHAFDCSSAVVLGSPPATVQPMTEAEAAGEDIELRSAAPKRIGEIVSENTT
jgi:2,5-furandicarboxylate decarboxylase 1